MLHISDAKLFTKYVAYHTTNLLNFTYTIEACPANNNEPSWSGTFMQNSSLWNN